MAFTIFTGGARSGKSALALQTAAASGLDVVFIATAEALDDEMVRRIGLHRAERPAAWSTIEEPQDVGRALELAGHGACVVLDCLSLWVSNLLFADVGEPEIVERAAMVADRMAVRSGPGVVVTNEVGAGIVPDNALARTYRDVLGRVNATFAERADRAFLAVMGRVLELERFGNVARFVR
jgi:adenosylcobinamide kinase/adenosylcobinamide-phosphate guanylyltransferase